MRTVADLHVHSRYSLATSPRLTAARLDRWARIKGIDLLGTGDCTHPAWAAELEDQLEEAGEGLYRLKEGVRGDFDRGTAAAEVLPAPGPSEEQPEDAGPRFVLSGELCTVYAAGGRTRKVHHLVLLPDFRAAAAFRMRLERVGKPSSDGRPVLGMDSRDLLELLLETDERSLLIPAHIWTPWFSVLGARSGFDSIEECYRDLAGRIAAVETGLSSDPPMNWAVGRLDRFAVVSNSDAHSPEHLGREATVLDMEPSFSSLRAALGADSPTPGPGVLETLEFFPQEGKYHHDGHRACGVSLSPEESAARGGLCPSCGKPVTPGVLRRVRELADRPLEGAGRRDAAGNRRPYRSLVPLRELLAEILGTAAGSRRVAAAYRAAVEGAGSEIALLLERAEEEIRRIPCPGVSGELLAEAVCRVRRRELYIRPGYDGEYGAVRALPAEGGAHG